MRAVIRFLTRGGGGTVEQRDKIFEGDAITLGRATDQVLHLKDRRVALEHARIFRRGDRILISSGALAGVAVNGVVTRDAALLPGDVVTVGSNTLRCFAPPEGFDLAFTFELEATARSAEAVREQPVLGLAGTRLAKRPWAWVLFCGVLTATLVVPVLGMKSAALRETLRTTAMPDDGWWSSGPLSPVHQNVATRCESCHERAFVRVRNDACLACHAEGLHQHAATPVKRLAQERCTACHLEHNEPASLVRRDPRLCADCHADFGGVATDFATAHPQFRLTVHEPGATAGEVQTRRVALDEAAGTERSGLVFPHDVHLTGRGLKTPSGVVVMQCGDCHQPEEGGARMRPIQMERHCASCHRLDFDPADPERTVPHGDPVQVLRTLSEYYSARYLEEYPDPHATARPARTTVRPGIDLSAVQRDRALEQARAKALSTARDLFERRTCHQCHAVKALAAPDGSPRWQVAPTLLTRRWLPKSRFSHARHATTLTACTTCHAATESDAARDILIPGIETCGDCHGGTAKRPAEHDRVRSDCTLCHWFHIPANDLWVGVGRVPGTRTLP